MPLNNAEFDNLLNDIESEEDQFGEPVWICIYKILEGVIDVTITDEGRMGMVKELPDQDVLEYCIKELEKFGELTHKEQYGEGYDRMQYLKFEGNQKQIEKRAEELNQEIKDHEIENYTFLFN